MKQLNLLILLLMFVFNAQAQDPNPLSEADFEKMRKEVADQSFDSKRLIKAKELSDAHYLYVSQIKAILEALSLEGNRLEYAKYAYSTTLDAENYKTLVDNFRMSANKEDLTNFLSKREPPVVPKAAPKTEEKTTATTNDVATSTSSSRTTTTSSSKTTVTTGPTPMADQDFAAAKGKAEKESFESSKLRRVKQISDANYLLSSQVKELLDVLSFESSRLEYSKYAYPKTYDQANYAIVKEGLKHSKSRDELGAFLEKQTVTDYTPKEVVVEENTKTTTSEGTPVETVAQGISEADFAQAKNQIAGQSSDSKKLEKAKSIAGRTSLTTAQAKSITDLFLFEENRLEFVKHAYANIVDKENFAQIKESLEKESHKTLDDFVKNAAAGGGETPKVAEGPSELSTEDFEALTKKIKGSALESHKLEKAKTIVDRSKVSSAQIQQINQLFTLEETRLEFAKYAYSKVLDKDNYKVVRDTLNKSTSRYNLDRFIKNQ